MKVVFRVDGGGHIGIGHFMRCLSLADELAHRGAGIMFMSRHVTPHLCELLAERGYCFAPLSDPTCTDETSVVPHAHWLGTSQQADAAEVMRVIGPSGADWVIVDSYSLDVRWEAMVRGCAGGVLVIDDVADRRHACDVLVDQNLYPDAGSRYGPLVPDDCRLLLGPDFALLRPEFAELRRTTAVRDGRIRRVLVSVGGADVNNHTLKVLQAIALLEREQLVVDVVIGAHHVARAAIEDLCRTRGFECHIQPRYIARLMAQADLAVGAAGSTSWERCCLGVPTVCITDAENQVPIAAGLAAHGAVVNLGDGRAVGAREIAGTLAELFDAPARLRSLSAASHELVDGMGALRVCSVLGA